MEDKEIYLRELNLPTDVIENSWDYIPFYGKLTGDPTEIIVITQYKREVFSGTVCHLKGDTIFDMPKFNPIKCHNPKTIKEIDGIKYTMACLAEKNDYPVTNWLY